MINRRVLANKNIALIGAGGYVAPKHMKAINVQWFLSTDRNDLPKAAKADGKTTFRSITVDEEEIEFSGGFTDLHTLVYQDIMSGGGFGVEAVRTSIKLVHEIRNAEVVENKTNYHPFLKEDSIK